MNWASLPRHAATVTGFTVYDIRPAWGWGRRVQPSVFECRLREGDVPKLTRRLKRILRTQDNGSIRLYRVCSRCAAKSVGFGDIEPPDEAVALVR